MRVPSGHRVARAMKLRELAPGDLDDLAPFQLRERTPLWFYILREAEVTVGGKHLGPVGGRIVAEVIVGLVTGDRQSYLSQDPDWTPTHGSDGSFTTVDLFGASGAVAAISGRPATSWSSRRCAHASARLPAVDRESPDLCHSRGRRG